MKTGWTILALFLGAGLLPAADLRPFPFYRDLQPPASGVCDVASAVLDRPIYAAADGPQVSLRIGDQDSREIPFHLRTKTSSKSALRETPFPAEVLSFRELPDNRVEIIARRDPRQPVPAGLRIHTAKLNFEKQVTVSGSADREQWKPLAEAIPIFDYSRFIDVRNDRVAFAPADFVFYKIGVANITEIKDSPLTEIIRKRAGGIETETTEMNSFRKEPFRMDRLEFIEQREITQSVEIETREDAVREWIAVPDDPRRQTEIAFDTACEPLIALALETKESNFSRAVVVFAAQTREGPWTELASSRISRVDAGKVHQQSLAIPLNGERRYRHYRVVIENQDNPPLTIAGIRARENLYEVIFFPKAGRGYRLYCGGRDIPAPSYDTATVLNAILPGATADWSLGAEQKNPDYKPDARSSFNSKSLMITAIVLMVGALVWAMARVMRKVADIGRE
jgi:hypothetical protein